MLRKRLILEKFLGKTHRLIPSEDPKKESRSEVRNKVSAKNKQEILKKHYDLGKISKSLEKHLASESEARSNNDYLHKKFMKKSTKNESHEDRIADISKDISKHEAPHTFNVYTGLKGNPFTKSDRFGVHITGRNKDGSFQGHLPAFTSTTIQPDVAADFASGTYASHKHMLKIRIPKGSKHGAYVGHISEHPHEREFLLDKGKNLKIHYKPEYYRKKEEGDVNHYFIWHAKIDED